MKKLHRVLVSWLSVVVLLVGFVVPIAADASAETSVIVEQKEFPKYSSSPAELLPFIYLERKGELFWRDYIGENDCEDGYLYVKNTETETINQVLTEKVVCFKETRDFLYCVTENNEIIKVLYSGSEVDRLYKAAFGGLFGLGYHAGVLYFFDGTKIMKFDLATQEPTVIMDGEEIVSIFPYDADKLLLEDKDGKYYAYDVSSDSLKMLANMYEVDELLAPEYNPAEIPGAITYALDLNGTSITFPLSEYPVGSYFTDNGGPCYDHSSASCCSNFWNESVCNCKLYAASAQCMAFARYASDQYAHLSHSGSGWLNARGNCTQRYTLNHEHLNTVSGIFGSSSENAALLSELSVGAYVRVLYDRNDDDDDGHSFVIVRQYDADGDSVMDGVITYDCNVDAQCGVSLRTRSYDSFSLYFDCISDAVSHDFSDPALRYSSYYHMVGCSGCSGYIYARHYTASASGNTCDACGYTGDIPVVVG